MLRMSAIVQPSRIDCLLRSNRLHCVHTLLQRRDLHSRPGCHFALASSGLCDCRHLPYQSCHASEAMHGSAYMASETPIQVLCSASYPCSHVTLLFLSFAWLSTPCQCVPWQALKFVGRLAGWGLQQSLLPTSPAGASLRHSPQVSMRNRGSSSSGSSSNNSNPSSRQRRNRQPYASSNAPTTAPATCCLPPSCCSMSARATWSRTSCWILLCCSSSSHMFSSTRRSTCWRL
jgi:hypothetical protein